MKISIFGLGYVGSVSLACLAKEGHDVIGVDVSQTKIDLINDGKGPIIEPGLNEYIAEGIMNRKIKAIYNAEYAVLNTDMSMICVGTPNEDNGELSLKFILQVLEEIALSLKLKDSFHLILIRSTVPPGSVRQAIELIEKISDKKYSKDFDVALNPEFLREGTAIYDYYNPPYTLVGTRNETSVTMLRNIYNQINAPFVETDISVAELIKFVNNSFHALKISFANEIGRLAKQLNTNGIDLMNIFMLDNKLNISKYYLNPGSAFGGSCLPKDTKALSFLGRKVGVEMPLLDNIINSNTAHITNIVNQIVSIGIKKVAFFGLAFKDNTDDLRESPIVAIIEALLGKGYSLKIYDEYVNFAKLYGSNKLYIEDKIPHISALMVSSPELISDMDLFIVTNKNQKFLNALNNLDKDKLVLDLAGIDKSQLVCNYQGICW